MALRSCDLFPVVGGDLSLERPSQPCSLVPSGHVARSFPSNLLSATCFSANWADWRPYVSCFNWVMFLKHQTEDNRQTRWDYLYLSNKKRSFLIFSCKMFPLRSLMNMTLHLQIYHSIGFTSSHRMQLATHHFGRECLLRIYNKAFRECQCFCDTCIMLLFRTFCTFYVFTD
jgi:hypothetical protein